MFHTRRQIVRVVIAGALALAVSACASAPKSETGAQRNSDVDFSTYKTFAWISDKPMLSGPGRTLDRNKERVEAAIVANLTSKGFTQIEDPEKADFTVAYTVGSRKHLGTSSVPANYHSGWRMYYGEWTSSQDRARNLQSYGSSKELTVYSENMLAIDLFDVKLGAPAWHGYSTKELTGDDRRHMENTINEAVSDILGYFPPPK